MSVKDILMQAGYKIVTQTHTHYRMKPLYRESSNHTILSVDKKTGFFVDFGTQQKGSLAQLVKMTTGGSVEFSYEPDKIEDLKAEIEIKFNKEEIKRLLPSYQFYNHRGISDQTLQTLQAGYCSYGKMCDRFVFPIINPDGTLVGLQGRLIREHPDRPKWKNLGHKTKFIYPLYFNSNEIVSAQKVVLVESIGNMLALWECGVKHVLVTFGTAISPKLLAALLSLNVGHIYVALDNDHKTPGSNPGQRGASKMIAQLNNWFDKSQIHSIVTPPDCDWGDVLKKEGKGGLLRIYESQI